MQFVLDHVQITHYADPRQVVKEIEMTRISHLHSRRFISVSEFRKNPIECVRSGDGALAIMSRNEPAFYCLPAEEYTELLELAEQAKSAKRGTGADSKSNTKAAHNPGRN